MHAVDSSPSHRSFYQPLRTALVALHVVFTVSWLSQAVALATLLGISATTASSERRLWTAEAAELLDGTVLVHSANGAAGTGLLLAALTTWGYLHHWWVAIKLVLTVGQLYAGVFVLSLSMPEVVEAARVGGPGPVATVAVGAGLMASGLAVQVWLSVAKPFGRTPLARRSRVRPVPAPSWLIVAAILAPVLDVPLGRAIGDPAPILTVLVLIVAIVVRQRGFGARRRSAQPGDGRRVVVDEVRHVATDVVVLRLAAASGSLEPWRPGAHVDLVLPSGLVRQYSLCGAPDDGAYEVAILLEPDGRGGSREIHTLGVGDEIGLRGPRNLFPLAEARRHLFVAGGIGITPMVPMIAAAEDRGDSWQLVYRGASRPGMAFAEELLERHGPSRVVLLPADEAPRPDLDALHAAQPVGTAAYCCGPAAMLEQFEVAARRHPHVAAYLERFDPLDLGALPSEPFDVVLAYSRRRVTVPAGVSMLEAVRPALPDVPASCETGVCGTCVLPVLAGRPDHRDAILHGPDREREDLIYPCVSRSAGDRLVLDA